MGWVFGTLSRFVPAWGAEAGQIWGPTHNPRVGAGLRDGRASAPCAIQPETLLLFLLFLSFLSFFFFLFSQKDPIFPVFISLLAPP